MLDNEKDFLFSLKEIRVAGYLVKTTRGSQIQDLNDPNVLVNLFAEKHLNFSSDKSKYIRMAQSFINKKLTQVKTENFHLLQMIEDYEKQDYYFSDKIGFLAKLMDELSKAEERAFTPNQFVYNPNNMKISGFYLGYTKSYQVQIDMRGYSYAKLSYPVRYKNLMGEICTSEIPNLLRTDKSGFISKFVNEIIKKIMEFEEKGISAKYRSQMTEVVRNLNLLKNLNDDEAILLMPGMVQALAKMLPPA